ncbi:hypothetical protein C7999DRAFT_10436 [Corynascus novoguineensis]|uniref:DOMON domain-containing protein n=1 Tax=Corynascus novoguineensis TaxID=1126955 RepID=A0AAN7D189_9PEZI|nr:hypothetical protein C7999DRAFT_10436 [Corynascus novoguineensis]
MKAFSWPSLAAALLGTSCVVGEPVQFCPSGGGGLCYGIAIPTSSANAGSGNIYFQIKAPTSLQWVALGTGSGMAGSNIFLMYQDGKGNVTLSPRLGVGYSEPKLDTSSTAARLTLLAGSGVSEDGSTMTANVACSNCQSWNGGEMSLKSSSAGWISAWKQGPSLATTDKEATIDHHDNRAQFRVDLTKATINSDSNPFVSTGSDGDSNGPGSGSGSGSGPGSGPDDGSGSSGGFTQISAPPRPAVLVAHGIIMALVMGLFYPLGSTIMPLVGKWWVHAAWQAVAFCLMWAGFGLGIVTGRRIPGFLWNEPHAVFGAVVICLLGIQPVFGILHHLYYLRVQRRGLISYVHIWWGRILMVLGVINGGLGLKVAREEEGPVIAYGVISGVVFSGYLGYKLCHFFRRGRAGADKEGSTSA